MLSLAIGFSYIDKVCDPHAFLHQNITNHDLDHIHALDDGVDAQNRNRGKGG